MTVTKDDFNKIWASTSSVPEYTFSDTDYKNGWEFVGNLPPTRAMWNKIQKCNDEKMQYLMENGTNWVDNVATLRTTNAKIGEVYGTKGYYTNNDGGQGFYIIRADASDTDDGGCIIVLNNGNVAELIVNDAVSVKQFGAKGDGVTDDTNAFRNAFLMPNLYIPSGNYNITDYLVGLNDVVCDGTFTSYTPLFSRPQVIKTIKNFSLLKDFLTGYAGTAYGEAITYNSTTKKIILGLYKYSSPAGTVLLTMNKDTFAIENTTVLSGISPIGTLSYNATDNIIYMNETTNGYVYSIDGDDMSSYTQITLPDGRYFIFHDSITNTNVTFAYDNARHSYNATVYNNALTEVLQTVAFPDEIETDSTIQDCCFYNGKLYVNSWAHMWELDVCKGTAFGIGIDGANEIEGCTFIDGRLIAFAHANGDRVGYEYLYEYLVDTTAQIYNELNENDTRHPADVNLNAFLVNGKYFVNTADTTGKNYPDGESEGIVVVTNDSRFINGRADFKVSQEFISFTSPYYRYYRLWIKSTDTWTAWKRHIFASTTTITNIDVSSITQDSTSWQEKYYTPNTDGFIVCVYNLGSGGSARCLAFRNYKVVSGQTVYTTRTSDFVPNGSWDTRECMLCLPATKGETIQCRILNLRITSLYFVTAEDSI